MAWWSSLKDGITRNEDAAAPNEALDYFASRAIPELPEPPPAPRLRCTLPPESQASRAS